MACLGGRRRRLARTQIRRNPSGISRVEDAARRRSAADPRTSGLAGGATRMAVEAPPAVAEPVVAAGRPGRRRRGDTARTWALGIWSALALLYLFIPVLIVALFSFNDPRGRFNFTWEGFTLDHWANPFANPDLALAMKNSFLIAGISTAIATAL